MGRGPPESIEEHAGGKPDAKPDARTDATGAGSRPRPAARGPAAQRVFIGGAAMASKNAAWSRPVKMSPPHPCRRQIWLR
jgi:hypothetical protein